MLIEGVIREWNGKEHNDRPLGWHEYNYWMHRPLPFGWTILAAPALAGREAIND